MTSLKCSNSGVASNGPSLINSLSEREVSSRAPVVLCSSEAHPCYVLFVDFPSELLVGHSSANDLLHDGGEPFRIGHLTRVKPESLLIDIAEEVKWLNTDVGSVQATLQQAPEILRAICMNVAFNISESMVDYLMSKFIKSVIGF